jgi:hypothetical protein
VTTVDTVAQAALAELDSISNLLVFDGRVPTLDTADRDDEGRAKPYAVLYPNAGQVRTSDRHAYTALDLYAGFQVTCAAGTPRGALWVVDQVRARLTGKRLLGASEGFCKEVSDPGPLRIDDDVPSDLRWFLPLQYRIATTN